MKKAIVVGAGIGGLGAAVRLAKKGFQVTVFDANEFVGGKINSKQIGNYRFDMGPSVFTGPEYVKELYDLCGEDFKEFEYQKLPESFNYYFSDGQNLRLPANRELMLDVFEKELGEDRKVVDAYLNKAAKTYGLIAPLFIESSLHRRSHMLNRKLFKALGKLHLYKLGQTMDEENRKTFKNPKSVQLMNRFASYNGSSAFKAPAMLNMISHLELNEGAYLPKDGMVQIPEKVKELAVKLGVTFRLGEKVTEIKVENKTVTGVKTDKGEYDADFVFSNMDIALTYKKLLPNQWQPTKILEQEKSSSAVVFYFGIKKRFDELGVHNIFFSANSNQEFANIFDKKEIYDDPMVYVNITSKEVKGDAPENCENWFVMVNAPINNGQDWEKYTKELREIVINKISRVLKVDLASNIEEETVMNPVFIEEKYSGYQGSIYGNASNNKYAAFYRHPNFSKKIKGLYFVGVTVHPGGGIPLALNSAKIAVRCLEEDYKL